MYGSKSIGSRNVSTTQDVGCVRLSKILPSEKPYTVKGNIKHTGSEELPKNICYG